MAAQPAAPANAFAAFDNYLSNVLVIQDVNVRNGLNEQGMDSFARLHLFSDDDVKQVCKVIRRPADGNVGVEVSFMTEKSLRKLAHFARHFHTIQRQLDENEATEERFEALWELKEAEDAEEQVDAEIPKKFTTDEHARQTMEDIDAYLFAKKGKLGAPLAYVVRDNVELPDAADDPGYDDMEYEEQLVQRSRHSGPAFTQDRKSVWTLLYSVFHDTPGWSWISRHSRSKNGRQAYLDLRTHFLGKAHTDRLVSRAEATLQKCFYTGTSRTFTFNKLATRLQSCFNDMESEELTEARKVRYLLRSIERSQLLTAPRAVIIASDVYSNSFKKSIELLSTYIEKHSSMQSDNRNLSAYGQGRGGGRGRGGRSGGRGRGAGGRGRGDGKLQVANRYYTPNEWRQLTPDQQQQVRQLREESNKRKLSMIETPADTRNAQQKTDTSATPSVTGANSNQVGDMMSQRRNNNQK